MNVLVGEHMSIINRKPQTTRHRILGIVNTDDYQIVFSDTPGRIHDNPKYEMQMAMNRFIRSSYQDADVVLFMTAAVEKGEALEAHVEEVSKLDVHLNILILNKCDLVDQEQIDALSITLQEPR